MLRKLATAILYFLFLQSPFAEETQVEGVVFVGGEARSALYTVKSQTKSLFSRDKFSARTGNVVGVPAANVLRVQTPNRTEELVLIGLIDVSPTMNPNLRKSLISSMTKKFLNQRVQIYSPKDFKNHGLFPGHGFAIINDRLVQAELLEQGLGITSHSRDYEPELLREFQKLMLDATENHRGIWKDKG